MSVSEGRWDECLEAEEAEGRREAEGRASMSCRGCLTHPALCDPRTCPDRDRKGYILSKIVSKYGRRNKGIESATSGKEVCEAQEEKGCNGPDLGGMASQDSGNRRRIEENCPPKADTFDRQRLDAQ